MQLTINEALERGIDAHKSKNYADADRYYTAILKMLPQHADANHNMGVLAVDLGKVEQSLAFFKKALEANSGIEQFWLSYVGALINLNRKDDARLTLDKALSIPENRKSFDKLNAIFQELSAAESVANQSLKAPEKKIRELIDLYKSGDLANVIIEAQKLLEQYPETLTVWNLLGASAAQTEQLDLAISSFENAIRIKPDFADAYNNLGNVLINQQKFDEAISAYEKAISLNPKFSEALYNLGVSYQDYGKHHHAIDAFKKAININLEYDEAYNNLGVTLYALENFDEALQAFSKATQINPNNAEAFNGIGNVFKKRGKLNKALKAYTKAVSLKSDYAEAIENQMGLEIQLSVDPISNNNTSGPSKRNSPKVCIFHAIHCFISGDFLLARQYIQRFNEFSLGEIDSLHPQDKLFCTAYAAYISKLIQFSKSIANINHLGEYVYHIGDSHCLSYAHETLTLGGLSYKVTPKVTFGGKAFHFCQCAPNQYKAITSQHILNIPNRSKVFISFGEIDCRENEGFIAAANKLKKPVQDIIENTVEEYINWFSKQNETKHHDLFFLNVPAPYYNKERSEHINFNLLDVITKFNKYLLIKLKETNFHLIDVNMITRDQSMFSNGKYHVDKRHLGPHTINEIERQLVK